MGFARARRRSATTGLTVLTVLAVAVPAHAGPVDGPRAADPPAPGDSVVLIVHAAGDPADVRATADDASSTTIDVRHTFPTEHAFSVSVPAGNRAAAESALRATPGVTAVETPVTRSITAVPDDPQYASEKAYLSSVNAPAAWDITHGSKAVRIAIIDTGIDVNHPDLKTKIYRTYDADDGGTAITDEVGHGTFVAGVAAADTDNAVGIAGAGYDTELLGVKIAGPDGELSVDDEIAGINWAVKNKADIINLSLSGTDYSAAEKAAVENAIAKGVLVVAAAGNDGNSALQYPAAYPGVVAVGATDTATHRRADFSSYGPWVSLAAPGVDIRSTSPLRGSEFFTTRSGYAQADGTSFSAPLVAGAAALLKAADPGATEPELRQALLRSASGLAGQGLGTGQIDFARALAHLPPATAPSAVSVTGSADRLTLTAATTAPAVEFRLDAGPWTVPAAARSGVASAGFDSWGYPNGPHTVFARSCSRYGECGTSTTVTTLDLANVAPDVTAPAAGSTATGRFTVAAEHPTGGGARLLVDGRAAGFGTTSPYSFVVNGSRLSDGAHTVQVVSCAVSGTPCAGPGSPVFSIVNRSLHPVITALTNPAISPNGDHSGDTAALRFTLPGAETVTAQTLGRTGVVVRSESLGPLAPGAHAWTWRGLDARGLRLPDGPYTLALVTGSTPGATPALAGYADIAGRVDTVAPGLSGATGANTTFYPVRDGYRDTFAPTIAANEAGTVTLTIRSGRGAVVRALTARRAAGRTTLVWDGRDSHGHLVAAGAYRFQYSIVDAAGNRRAAADDRVTVSGRRLVARVAYIRHRGASYRSAGGSDPCSHAHKRASDFRHGVDLSNACGAQSGAFAFAAFRFTVPGAIRYARVTFQVYGRSVHRPSELSVAVDRVDGGLEIPAYVQVTRSGSRWYSIASVPAAGHITGSRAAYASVLLTGRYRGTNDFDLKYARLRVSYTALG